MSVCLQVTGLHTFSAKKIFLFFGYVGNCKKDFSKFNFPLSISTEQIFLSLSFLFSFWFIGQGVWASLHARLTSIVSSPVRSIWQAGHPRRNKGIHKISLLTHLCISKSKTLKSKSVQLLEIQKLKQRGQRNLTCLRRNSPPIPSTMFLDIRNQHYIFLRSPWSFLHSLFITTRWPAHFPHTSPPLEN